MSNFICTDCRHPIAECTCHDPSKRRGPATQPQPEEVKPCPTTKYNDSGSNAAPQGSEPPAGAAKVSPTLAQLSAHLFEHDLSSPHLPPPPQPQGGTPECDELLKNLCEAKADPIAESIAFHQLAKKFERQRNEARAALAAAQAEVERLQGDKTNMLEELDVRGAEMQRLRAETRRELAEARKIDIPQAVLCLFDEIPSGQVIAKGLRADSLTVLNALKNRAFALIDDNAALRQALTAAEQRADGAEKERESCHQLFDQVIALCGFTKGGGYPGIVGSVEHLAGQRDDAREERDTAIRERDGEKAMLDWLERVALTRDSQSVTLQWVNPDDHSEYIRMEITHHIPLDEFYASETLRQAIASHQQEITP